MAGKMTYVRLLLYLATTALLLEKLPVRAAESDPAASAQIPHVIFDTDMAGDCDDAGALAVLYALLPT